jgi:hypothetical protein
MHETIQTPRAFESTGFRETSAGTPSEPAPQPKTEQLLITRSVPAGEIISIETIDLNGQRAAISDEAVRGIVGQDELDELDGALDEAFDSGVTMLFEETDDGDGTGETAELERTALLRALALALAGRRAIRRLANARRNLLQKLILRRLARRYFLRHRAAAS